MALQPLDLQTLFTQIDKVGKLQSAERDGLAVQQSMQSGHLQKKNDEQVHSVDQTKEDEETEAINDRRARKKSEKRKNPKKEKEEDPETKKPPEFRDPSLGKHIDLSF
ncbi:MAG: hypothetical protein LBG90_06400 [Spirochaetaceae bacterium]|jgi:hypothetical protein|nr:hypothetical protein [Spirochaetaceae bacterium]